MNEEFSLAKKCIFAKLSQGILDNCEYFSCGNEDLDEFFFKDAIAYDHDLMGKTYCWVLRDDITKIVAMVTLANASIQTTHLQNNTRRRVNKNVAYNKQGRTYPAVLIGRLGVNSLFQSTEYHIGSQVMNFIKEWFKSSDNKTGCRFVLVDAINNTHTIRYYERNGFKPLFSDESKEKEFYDIADDEFLRTRMFFFDLL